MYLILSDSSKNNFLLQYWIMSFYITRLKNNWVFHFSDGLKTGLIVFKPFSTPDNVLPFKAKY